MSTRIEGQCGAVPAPDFRSAERVFKPARTLRYVNQGFRVCVSNRQKQQVPPLRCASVGMTILWDH
jgi:hypothetical protein